MRRAAERQDRIWIPPATGPPSLQTRDTAQVEDVHSLNHTSWCNGAHRIRSPCYEHAKDQPSKASSILLAQTKMYGLCRGTFHWWYGATWMIGFPAHALQFGYITYLLFLAFTYFNQPACPTLVPATGDFHMGSAQGEALPFAPVSAWSLSLYDICLWNPVTGRLCRIQHDLSQHFMPKPLIAPLKGLAGDPGPWSAHACCC